MTKQAINFESAVKSENYKNIIANITRKFGVSKDNPDWNQEFQIMLWQCTEKYDESRGDFWGFAYYSLNGVAIKLAAKDRLVQLPYDAICGNHGHDVERNMSCEFDSARGEIDEEADEEVTTKLSLAQALARLTKEERYLVEAKHGMIKISCESENIDKIAQTIGMSTTAARKTYATAINKMKAFMQRA